jgi:hypothetical protein
MKRNVLLVCALAAAVAFTLLARTAADRTGDGRSGTAAAGGGTATGGGAGAGGTGGAGLANGGATRASGPGAPGVQGGGPDGAGGQPGEVRPDSFFTPTRLAPGERPPQFIVVSFDGAGSHQKWQFWQGVARQANMRFTAFLSGVYLVGIEHRAAYRGPGHRPGQSSIGFPPTESVQRLILDLNGAWRSGEEIGTHYNGHFCAGSGYHGQRWTTADWSSELQQFHTFFTRYREVNGDPGLPELQVPAGSVRGGRTPCLEGRPNQLMPALRSHGFSYDSSGVHAGIAWPRRNSYGIWEFPLAYVRLAGSRSGVISMDYNFWVKQTGNPPGAGNSVADSAQIQATYQRMYDTAYHGNRAPLILGNHFNSWNNDAYAHALASFALTACHRPDTYCVPYRDVIRWMQAQDPKVLAALQRLPAVDAPGA